MQVFLTASFLIGYLLKSHFKIAKNLTSTNFRELIKYFKRDFKNIILPL